MASEASRSVAEALAPAKINLTLHVTGQRADGYHLLDSLVMFADLGDRLGVALADAPVLTVTGPMTAGVPLDGDNLALRAAAHMGVNAAIALEKHLPAAAGIGGGSSDAAAALRALAALSGQALPDDAERLGADVPACLFGRAVRMRGVGERLTPYDGAPALPALLVNPGVELSTARVFAGLEHHDNPPMPESLPRFATPRAMAGWLATMRNDLEVPARALSPLVGIALDALRATAGAHLVRMSGSGATVFAIYDTGGEAGAAAEVIRAAHPGWWVQPVTLG
ncbi:MAG: 4-(cytidine 5'-diphospho)-2-C-methyl-D-erythritol kinase [Rhodobacteraceae bacterium HLUCCO07]|nr:MAG: 4-(cytidine 5'-diphospho)-2-C-methyl-D-erythritol kinase [Rhodobacteraceae bacterium HLUCCO07]